MSRHDEGNKSSVYKSALQLTWRTTRWSIPSITDKQNSDLK